ncbi:MAG TPA: hypothetical protein VFG14_08520 [Chthoniobacteraceae bacterium]|jgi:hypothetical protein|nr:hypothetical protein [Chthoniobacteraceae bacterium]
MQAEVLFLFRMIFTGLFIGTIFAGYYLLKNYQRLFGVDPNIPSENGSARAYSKVQIFCVWAHAVFLTGAFALLLH